MNINKFITESIDNTNNNELAVSDDETAFSDTLLQLSLPAAISAGLGALNLRKVESGEIYEVDWEEVADKAGKIGTQIVKKTSDISDDIVDSGKNFVKIKGRQLARTLDNAGEDVVGFGKDFVHGIKKVATRAAEDVSDKFQGKGPISGLVKAGKRKLEDTQDDSISTVSKLRKSITRPLLKTLDDDSILHKTIKSAHKSTKDKIENFDSKKFADNMRASDGASPYHLVPKK